MKRLAWLLIVAAPAALRAQLPTTVSAVVGVVERRGDKPLEHNVGFSGGLD